MDQRRSAVVTGAGGGIGRAVALRLLASGWSVSLAGRRREPLEETAAVASTQACVLDAGESTLVVPTDVGDPDQVSELFRRTVEAFGRVDVLFNNAGVFGPAADAASLEPADLAEVLRINVAGAVHCASAAVQIMRAQNPVGGRIINNGSISAQVPRPRSVAYAVSKHAVAGLTKSLIIDGRAHRITATQVDFGNAATDFMAATDSGTGALQADGSRRVEPTFDVAHAAELVLRVAELPVEVTVDQLTVTATGMPFAGRG